MFNFDWFHHGGLDRLVDEAKSRCAGKRFPDHTEDNGSSEFEEYRNQLDTRVILYLKDGLTYEMKEIADVGMSSALTFEAVPMDENYKVGSIVLIVPFEDIARVEVFAVHPDDKPQENIRIPGFQSAAAGGGSRD
ncbi:MAG: hypothetical protein IT450_14945 [Phycisphaerales bacterium]|nr:hypothetical protein [Phycisphaerales bacterium]